MCVKKQHNIAKTVYKTLFLSTIKTLLSLRFEFKKRCYLFDVIIKTKPVIAIIPDATNIPIKRCFRWSAGSLDCLTDSNIFIGL